MIPSQRDEVTAKMTLAHLERNEDAAGQSEGDLRSESLGGRVIQPPSTTATSPPKMHSPTENPTDTTLPNLHHDDSSDENSVDDILHPQDDNYHQHRPSCYQQRARQQQQLQASSSAPLPEKSPPSIVSTGTNPARSDTLSAQHANSSAGHIPSVRSNSPITGTVSAQGTNSAPTVISPTQETYSEDVTSTGANSSFAVTAVVAGGTDSAPAAGTTSTSGAGAFYTGTTSAPIDTVNAQGSSWAPTSMSSSASQLGSSPLRLYRDLEQYIEAEYTYNEDDTSPPPSPAVSTVHWNLSPVSPPLLPLPGSPPHHSHQYPTHYPSLSPQSPSSSLSFPSISSTSSLSSSASSLIPPELYQDNNPEPPGQHKSPPVPAALGSGCEDAWRWNVADKSHEVRVCGRHFTTAFFHPNWSNGTAGVRGTRPLNQGLHYWEIRVSSRLFGTSMMFGVASKKARLHADSFVNLLGEDRHSWGVSHKGLAWHGGRSFIFCPPFPENVAVTVGMVYDSANGTLEYFKDGISLGVAFTGLHLFGQDLYPAVCSTAAKTEMTLGVTRRSFLSLQDRCRASVVTRLLGVGRVAEVGRLPLPRVLRHYVWDEAKASLILRPRIVSLLGRT